MPTAAAQRLDLGGHKYCLIFVIISRQKNGNLSQATLAAWLNRFITMLFPFQYTAEVMLHVYFCLRSPCAVQGLS